MKKRIKLLLAIPLLVLLTSVTVYAGQAYYTYSQRVELQIAVGGYGLRSVSAGDVSSGDIYTGDVSAGNVQGD